MIDHRYSIICGWCDENTNRQSGTQHPSAVNTHNVYTMKMLIFADKEIGSIPRCDLHPHRDWVCAFVFICRTNMGSKTTSATAASSEFGCIFHYKHIDIISGSEVNSEWYHQHRRICRNGSGISVNADNWRRTTSKLENPNRQHGQSAV